MTVDYRVELTVGPHSWSIERGDPPEFPAGIDVLDGLRVAWSMPETDLWPAQPNPTALSFALLAASADQLDAVDTGTPVQLLIYASLMIPGEDDELVEFPSVRFVGKVAELTGTPYHAGGQLAWRLDVQAVDLIAALADENIAGFSVDPDETAGPYGWVWGYFTYCEIPPPDWGFGSNEHSQLANPLVRMPSETLLSAVDKVMARYADAGPVFGGVDGSHDPNNHVFYPVYGWQRGLLAVNIGPDNQLDPDTPYAIDWVSRRHVTTTLNPAEPGKLVWTGSTWSIEFAPPPATTWDPFFEETAAVNDWSVVVDAAYLDFNATWSRSKFLDPNRIILTDVSGSDWNSPDDWAKLVRNTPKPRPAPYEQVTAQLADVRVIDPFDARHVGDMYVDGAYDNPNNRYEAQAFTWYASRDPSWPILRSLFPDSAGTSLWFGGYSAPITITNLPAEQSPNGARWYSGTLKGVDWTFDRGEFNVGLSLWPRIPRPIRQSEAPSPASLAVLPGTPPTPANLNPADTVMDWRLVRPFETDYPTGP